MIVRTWRGWVRTDRAADYADYIDRTGLTAYRATPGNLGAQMWHQDLGDGRTEVVTVSWWSSRADIEGFAGPDIDRAVFYPEDDTFLVDRELTVQHHEVVRGS
jgi:heme-degrading monooxygenase HmoA